MNKGCMNTAVKRAGVGAGVGPKKWGMRVDYLGKVKSSFILFLTKRTVSYQMFFIGQQDIVSSRSYSILKS